MADKGPTEKVDPIELLEAHLGLPGGVWFSHMEWPPALILPDGRAPLKKGVTFLYDGLQISDLGRAELEKRLDTVYLNCFELAMEEDFKSATVRVGLEWDASWDNIGAMVSEELDLSVGQPRILLGYTDEASGWQADVYGILSLWGVDFDVAVSWPDKVINATYKGRGITISDLLSSLHFPEELVHGTISAVDLTIDTPHKSQEVDIKLGEFGIGGEGANLDRFFHFENTKIHARHSEDFKSGSVSTRLIIGKKPDQNDGQPPTDPSPAFDIEASYDEGSFSFHGISSDIDINIGNLARKLTGGIVPMPSVVDELEITMLEVKLEPKDKNYSFTCGAVLGAEKGKPDSGIELGLTLSVGGAAHEKEWTAYLEVGKNRFTFGSTGKKEEDEAALDVFVATYINSGDAINLRTDLAAEVVQDQNLVKLVPPIDLEIDEVFFANVKEKPNGEETAPPSSKVFGMSVSGFDIRLTDLPLLKGIPGMVPVGISDFQIVMATHDVPASGVKLINNALVKPDSHFQIKQDKKLNEDTQEQEDAGLGKGFSMSGKIELGDEPLHLFLGGGEQTEAKPKELPAEPTENPVSTTVTGPYDDAHWFNVQKKLGPLYLHKIGMNFYEGEIWVIPQVDFTMSGLTISLTEFAVSSPLDSFSPTFHLQGLGIEYANGPVEIGGAFMRTPEEHGSDGYYGSVIAKTESLSLAALGGYSSFNGEQSMFVYFDLDYPIGGPPFFFVTGMTAGFGYNRTLNIPKIDDLAKFPFITTAGDKNQPKEKEDSGGDSTDLTAVLGRLHEYVKPSSGDQWLAVGLHFTSFEIVKAFALLTVSFGHKFEINVLGDATLSYPPEEEKPLTNVEILFDAKYLPDEGTLGVRAIVADGSYVFEPACKLTGGLAFKTWFKDTHKLGERSRKDEFVFTLGGYHPHFKIPSYYPKVDRLTLNWQKSDALTIKGSMYFAMTGHALMAGGALDATWESGDLKAWLKIAADFLIIYKPFHYDASMSIDIGAQVTIHFFGTHHLSVNLGAHLHIWGPDFSGTASFDIWVASFSVSFGDGPDKPKPLTWDKFQQTFLPAVDEAVLTISVQSGLVKDLKGFAMDGDYGVLHTGDERDKHWLINAKHFCLNISSLIPANLGLDTDVASRNATGISSMALGPDAFRSSIFVKISRKVERTVLNVTQDDFVLNATRKNVPAGLWGTKHQAGINDKRLVADVVTGLTLTLKPEFEGPLSRTIERSKLAYDTEIMDGAFDWLPDDTNITSWVDDFRNNAAFANPEGTTLKSTVLGDFFGAKVAVDLMGDLAVKDVILGDRPKSKTAEVVQ